MNKNHVLENQNKMCPQKTDAGSGTILPEAFLRIIGRGKSVNLLALGQEI